MRTLSIVALSPLLISNAFAQSAATGATSSNGGPVGGKEFAVSRAGTRAATFGSPENFTGSVRVDPLFRLSPPARGAGSYVSFEPGARTAWHTHPLGQTLIVTAGVGRVQRWGAPPVEIRVGDVVWIPPGEKHWHGAAPTTSMTHLAVGEADEGKTVDWLEKVTEEQFQAEPQH